MPLITPKIRTYLAGTLAGAASEGIVLLAGFISLWLLTQILDKPDFGLYAFVLAGFAVVGNIVTLGIDRLLLYRLGESAPKHGRLHGGDYVSTGLLLVVVASVLIGSVMIAMAHLLVDDFWQSTTRLWVMVSVACLPAYGFAAIYEAWLTANQRVPTARLMIAVQPLVRVISLLAVYFYYADRDGVALTVIASAFVPLIVWLMVAPLSALRRPRILVASDIAYSLRLMGIALMRVANQRLDIIMVGLLLSNAFTAEYAVVSRIANLVSTPRRLLNPVFQPRFRFALANGQHDSLYREYAQYRLFEMVGTLLAVAFMVVAGAFILSIFGDYSNALIVLVLLSLAHLVNSMFGPNMQYLNLAGYASASLATSAVLLGLGVITNFILIPMLGIAGAAFATALSALGVGVVISILIHRWDGFHTTDIAGIAIVIVVSSGVVLSVLLTTVLSVASDVTLLLAGSMVVMMSVLLLFIRRKLWLPART